MAVHDLLKGREYNRNKAMEGFDEVNDPRITRAVVHQGGYADVLLRPTMVGILRCGKMLPPQLNLVIEIEFADATTALWSENAGAHPAGATLSTDFEIQNVRVLANHSHLGAGCSDAAQIALDFFHQWGFLIDQDKSWTWSTVPTKELHHAPIFKPARSAKNLGCFVRYKKSTHHGDLGTRIQEGTRRAAVLAALPYEQEGRMSAIQAGPYASAFYGSEVHYVGHKPLAKLRKNVANIIAKPHKGLNRPVALLSYKSGSCSHPSCVQACQTIQASSAWKTRSAPPPPEVGGIFKLPDPLDYPKADCCLYGWKRVCEQGKKSCQSWSCGCDG